MLFWLAMAMLLPAIVLGLSKSERPILEPARGLFVPAGAVLMLYGALVWRGRAQWIGLGASDSWWLARGGLWMFGLSWPLLVLWALGLQSFD